MLAPHRSQRLEIMDVDGSLPDEGAAPGLEPAVCRFKPLDEDDTIRLFDIRVFSMWTDGVQSDFPASTLPERCRLRPSFSQLTVFPSLPPLDVGGALPASIANEPYTIVDLQTSTDDVLFGADVPHGGTLAPPFTHRVFVFARKT